MRAGDEHRGEPEPAHDYELVTDRLGDPETPYFTYAERKDVLPRLR